MIFDFSDPLGNGIGFGGALFLFDWTASGIRAAVPLRSLALLGVGI